MRAWILLLLVAIPAFAGREFVAASSQLMVVNTDPVTMPLTVSVWARRTDSTSRAVLALNTTTNSTERLAIFWGSSNAWSLSAIGGTVSEVFGSSNTVGTLTHLAIVCASSTSRSIYVGGSKATDTSSNTADGFNQIVIGARKNTTFGAFWNGGLAEVAVWNEVLTDSEIKQLADGLSPHGVRPGARVAYLPLWGASTPEVELWKGYTVLHTNAPAGANGLHPPIYR